MILSAYYNKQNECLTITKSNKEVTNFIKNENVVTIYNENEVIGINVFTNMYSSGLVDLNNIDSNILDVFGEYEYPFVYGEILTCDSHPKSSKLKICSVSLGNDKVTQIVCGASNCKAGMIAVVALEGAIMLNSTEIKPSKLINVASNGMLCSMKELGLVQETEGIKLYNLGEKEVGSPFLVSDNI